MERARAPGSRRWRWTAGFGLMLALLQTAFAQDPLPPGLFSDELPGILPAAVAQPADEEGAKPATTAPTEGSLESQLSQVLQTPRVETIAPALDAPVTSLTLSPSTVGKSPAAVFVIDQEMIRRSGAQTLPEVLRMVPGVHVGVGNTAEPNVSIRGLGAGNIFFPYSSRVLVLIDGRSIYDPVVGGVIWSPNDVVLQDVERIEVIRGPGATVWGANAVNGVINVITKSAADTQGTLLQGLGGTEYKTIATARVGAQVGDHSHMRIFGKFRDFDPGFPQPDAPVPNDGLHDFRGGFRYDYDDKGADKITLQGNYFNLPRGSLSYLPGMPGVLARQPAYEYSGGNAQSTWTHEFDNETQLRTMAIYDRLNFANQANEFSRDSYILDAAYTGSWGERHKWLAGGQVRIDSDSITPLVYPTVITLFDPLSKTYTTTSWLVQDEIQIIPDGLSFLAGTKMEVNAFTGFEIQPSGRLMATWDEERVSWAAVSRAIRRPNRIDDAAAALLFFPPQSTVTPATHLKSDALVAYEVGYRAQPIEWFSWDVATFFNVYDHLPLLTQRVVPMVPQPVWTQSNLRHAESTGAELTGTVTLTEQWKVTGSYSYLQIWVHNEEPAIFPPVLTTSSERATEEGYPNHIIYLRNSWSPTKLWDVDLIFRGVTELAARQTPAHGEIDLRIAWRPRPGLELALMGLNLLDQSHPEFGIPADAVALVPFVRASTEVERSVYASVTYQY